MEGPGRVGPGGPAALNFPRSRVVFLAAARRRDPALLAGVVGRCAACVDVFERGVNIHENVGCFFSALFRSVKKQTFCLQNMPIVIYL